MLFAKVLPYDFLRKNILPLDQIDQAISKNAKVVDLGCGQGILASFLAREKTRQVVGVDLDTRRIPKSKSENLKFKSSDIRDFDLKDADAITISDVLHHLNKEDQEKLLVKISKSLRKGGTFIVKEIDTEEMVRSSLSRFWDFVFYPKDKINYWSAKKLKAVLEKLGFSVIISRPCRFFPGSTTLFICSKK